MTVEGKFFVNGTRYFDTDSIGVRVCIGENDTALNITIDRQPPAASLVSPDNDTWHLDNVTLVYNVNNGGKELANCSLYVDDEHNQTQDDPPEGNNEINLTSLTNGNHSWYVECYDLVGNSNSSQEWMFRVDSLAPSVTLHEPDEYSFINSNSKIINEITVIIAPALKKSLLLTKPDECIIAFAGVPIISIYANADEIDVTSPISKGLIPELIAI